MDEQIKQDSDEQPQEVHIHRTEPEVIKEEPKVEPQPEIQKDTTPILDKIKKYYINNYKKLLIIPNIILILAILQIGFQAATTGDFLNKGVSLKGGITLTVPTDTEFNIDDLTSDLSQQFPELDINARELTSSGAFIGFTLDADLDTTQQDKINQFLESVRKSTGIPLVQGDYTLEAIGSSLGSSFFKETFRAMIFAFLFMALVVLIYFRKLVPAGIVILAVVSDIIATLAVVNLLNIKLSTAGIAAFLMLIGYSVDTDMLLSTRMLRRKDLSMNERIFSSLKTGLMMSCTTLVAIIVALIFSDSAVISQIMTILFIGLVFDLIFTWFQNMGILRLYMEKKEGQHEI
jgi:preprotein translocase subunit SecF